MAPLYSLNARLLQEVALPDERLPRPEYRGLGAHRLAVLGPLQRQRVLQGELCTFANLVRPLPSAPGGW